MQLQVLCTFYNTTSQYISVGERMHNFVHTCALTPADCAALQAPSAFPHLDAVLLARLRKLKVRVYIIPDQKA